MKRIIQFQSSPVTFYFDEDVAVLHKILYKNSTVIITDKNVSKKHKKSWTGFKTIVIEAGEQFKRQATVDDIIHQLIQLGADRHTTLVGIGGGVVTDITGYVAGVYMRGIPFGFIPTSILAMVDASIGGKNGIDVGMYKNMVGLIRQPSFILYDYQLLSTLPKAEWVNGFAEIIKHACIKDRQLFSMLEATNLQAIQKDKVVLSKLIRRNVAIKTTVVQQDEFEKGDRKLLNFGHTFGHAIENLYSIPHGHAVSIGIGIACAISEKLLGFKGTDRVVQLLKKYGLPPQFQLDVKAVLPMLKADKKRAGNEINLVLLKAIGKAVIHPVSFDSLEQLVQP